MKKVLYLSLPLVVLSSCTGETAASDFSDVQEALEKTINLNYGDTRFDLMIIKNEGKENETTNYAYYEIKNNVITLIYRLRNRSKRKLNVFPEVKNLITTK